MDYVKGFYREQRDALTSLWSNKRQVRNAVNSRMWAVLCGGELGLTVLANRCCVHGAVQFALQGLNLAMIIFSALMLWKGLMVYTDSESPVVVVLR